MDINLTLIIQMLVFAVFVWFTMRFVWPPLSKAMEERQAKIADGLAAAERARKELELTQYHITQQLKEAKVKALEITEKASQQAMQLIETAKDEAREEAAKLLKTSQEQLRQEVRKATEELQNQVAKLALVGAEKILNQTLDEEKAKRLVLDNFIAEI